MNATHAASSLDTTPARVLSLAAERLGGAPLLAEALEVSPMQAACWLSGLHQPPRPIVLRALAILLERASDAGQTARPTGAP